LLLHKSTHSLLTEALNCKRKVVIIMRHLDIVRRRKLDSAWIVGKPEVWRLSG